MKLKDFEDTYAKMVDVQLLDLTVQLEDLVPEARQALNAELQRRGKSPADIEQYAIAKKAGLAKDASEPWSPTCNNQPAGAGASGDEQPEGLSYMREGPVPADWVHVPGFRMDESMDLAECMEQSCIPYQILQGEGGDHQQCHLVVGQDRFKDCIQALKERFGLIDEAAEPFTGECPACGVMLTSAATCSECGLNLCQDQWDAWGKHPFIQFLTAQGFGKKQNQQPAST